MQERREEKRVSVFGDIEVVDKDEDEPIGRLVDISPKGLRIKGQVSIEVNEFVDLLLRLPERIFGKKDISVVAQCLWTNPDTDPNYITSGFRIHEVSQVDINTIIGLILEAQKENSE